jgi:hypothetical protein
LTTLLTANAACSVAMTDAMTNSAVPLIMHGTMCGQHTPTF